MVSQIMAGRDRGKLRAISSLKPGVLKNTAVGPTPKIATSQSVWVGPGL